jgi:hypothetical protein
MLLTILLLLPSLAQVTEYTSRPAWESAVGSFQTASFSGYAAGTVITNQYSPIGMAFTQGNDTVLYSSAFVVDGVGVNCGGDMEITFSTPQHAIGCDFPGALKIVVYNGSTVVHSSSNFAGSGSGYFGGLVSTAAFDRAVISDWVDGLAYVDSVSISGGFTLAKSGSCPGPVTLSTAGGTANSAVALLYGIPGSTTKPSGICAGTTVSLANPQLAAMLVANASGAASLSFNAPAGACGRSVQAVDIASCATSNTIVL